MFRDFVSLIFPRTCLSCKQSLISQEQFICTSCKIDLPFTDDHQNPTNSLFQKFAYQNKVKSAISYLYFQRKGITQRILHELKYNGKKDLGYMLGTWFAPQFMAHQIDMVIPVPLHKSKLRQRTYNQSEQIARGIADQLAVPSCTDLISREVATDTQTKKSKVQRWINLENVYSTASQDVAGKSVLIVDDVVTTGATVGMLSERLIESNVREIHIASLARGK